MLGYLSHRRVCAVGTSPSLRPVFAWNLLLVRPVGQGGAGLLFGRFLWTLSVPGRVPFVFFVRPRLSFSCLTKPFTRLSTVRCLLVVISGSFPVRFSLHLRKLSVSRWRVFVSCGVPPACTEVASRPASLPSLVSVSTRKQLTSSPTASSSLILTQLSWRWGVSLCFILLSTCFVSITPLLSAVQLMLTTRLLRAMACTTLTLCAHLFYGTCLPKPGRAFIRRGSLSACKACWPSRGGCATWIFFRDSLRRMWGMVPGSLFLLGVLLSLRQS